MLDWSYNLLSDLEKRVLCRLSIFVGNFTVKAAFEVAADEEVNDAFGTHAVTRLLEKSPNASGVHDLMGSCIADSVGPAVARLSLKMFLYMYDIVNCTTRRHCGAS